VQGEQVWASVTGVLGMCAGIPLLPLLRMLGLLLLLRLRANCHLCADCRLRPDCTAPCRDAEVDLVPVCRELGIGIVAYSPLGRGMLTGAFSKPEDIPEGEGGAG
jgi:hypothetical protein